MKKLIACVAFSLTSLISTPIFADTAILAGGCFWCVEKDFEALEGVSEAISGFTGGTHENPTYQGAHTGHYEAVKITYDPAVVSYEDILKHFWVNHDPFDARGQFCDKGPSYRSAIFVGNAQEAALAAKSKEAVVAKFPEQRVYTEILEAAEFWPVEEGHQDYYLKNSVRYKYYRWSCGRDQRLEKIWGAQAGH